MKAAGDSSYPPMEEECWEAGWITPPPPLTPLRTFTTCSSTSVGLRQTRPLLVWRSRMWFQMWRWDVKNDACLLYIVFQLVFFFKWGALQLLCANKMFLLYVFFIALLSCIFLYIMHIYSWLLFIFIFILCASLHLSFNLCFLKKKNDFPGVGLTTFYV